MSVQAYINRGIIYVETCDYKSAKEDFSHAIGINPNDYEIYLFRYIAYNALGEEKLANADLEKAYKLDSFATEHWIQRRMNPSFNPDSAEAHIQNGLESLCSGEYDIAIAECTEAIKIGSQSDSSAYNNRGMAHTGKGNDASNCGKRHVAETEYALAIEDHKKALALDPEDKDAKVHSNLGTAYYFIQEYNTAIENLTQAIERLSKTSNLDPDSTKTFSNSFYYRGLSYINTRKFYLAKKDFEKILAIYPDDYKAKQLLISVSQWL